MIRYQLFKKIAFCFDPEKVHELFLGLFHSFPKSSALLLPGLSFCGEKYRLQTNHLNWDFPVGLAAGFDKNAVALNYFHRLGFGSVEVGSVTPKPQSGNERPRIFRYEKEKSLRNFMGIPNLGKDQIAQNLRSYTGKMPFGVNLSKNSTTSEEESSEDYLQLYESFAPLAQYLVINISCPNVPGGRKLQSGEKLAKILERLSSIREQIPVPLFIKISPELAFEEIADLVDVAEHFKLAGIIATNTIPMAERGKGGISGELLSVRAKEVREQLLTLTAAKPHLDIIGVGGFSHFSQILDFWKKGGALVQIYTSFIYQGPQILKDIQKEIDALLKLEGFETLQEYFQKKIKPSSEV